jgi:hypothetical protein
MTMQSKTFNKLQSTACGISLLLGLALASSQVVAQPHGPPDPMSRQCVLLGMLGGNLPPHCRGEEDPDGLDPEIAAQIDALRLATVAFHSFDVANAAGWNIALSDCVESPMGGMGYHIANMDQLTNGGLMSVLRPEVLLYAPTEDGSMEFLGVEYIVPAPDWPHEHPPEILGQQLHWNPVQEIWALHVWSARHNPEGIFADWNPEVSCEFAAD